MNELPAVTPGQGLDLLGGVMVIDMTTSIAGPYATMLLADFGARVVKIERPSGGDDSRDWGPPFLADQSLWFLSVNRNKESVALDIARPEGSAILLEFIKHADVVVTNQPPRVQAKLGTDFQTLKAIRDDLVFASITGFGLTGSRADGLCYDLIAEGYSGVMDLTGVPDREPQKVGAPAADMLAGQDAAMAVMAALVERGRGGRRQCLIDVSIVESMTRFLSCRIVPYLGSGEAPRRQAFETADEPVTLGLGTDAIWQRFWKAVGKPEPAYPWHSACGDVCSQYVLYEGVTVMGFKVASRVRGLSDEAFGEAFGTKEQCRAALVRLRWPGGFVCPWCGHREHCVLAGRGLYQCNRCKKQTSPTAGTIFHATKLPLTLWFAAIHLIVTAKNGISSVELGRRLGVKQPTAWAVKHKIMAVMARREGETALTGRVEMDDAYLGGVRSGGKRGRGAAGKTPFVAAVSTSPEGRPRKLKLAPVKGFRKREIARGAKHWLAPGAAVVTDGLGCWSALEEAACSHQAIRTGSGRQAARMASFKSVNTTLGNIKSAITGTYRKLGPDHAGRYLASFAWRYNPRYQLQTMIPRFVHSAARTQPMPYRLLIAG